MPDDERITCVCTRCGYTSIWTRDQVLQLGMDVIYRGREEDIYSLKCRNPAFDCPQRFRVPVKRKAAR